MSLYNDLINLGVNPHFAESACFDWVTTEHGQHLWIEEDGTISPSGPKNSLDKGNKKDTIKADKKESKKVGTMKKSTGNNYAEDVMDRLKSAGVDISKASASWESPNPLKYSGEVSQQKADKVESVIKELKSSMNSFQRPNIDQIYDKIGGNVKELHEALYKLHEQGKIQLQPYTLAVGTMPSTKNLMPLDRELKYYIGLK